MSVIMICQSVVECPLRYVETPCLVRTHPVIKIFIIWIRIEIIIRIMQAVVDNASRTYYEEVDST